MTILAAYFDPKSCNYYRILKEQDDQGPMFYLDTLRPETAGIWNRNIKHFGDVAYIDYTQHASIKKTLRQLKLLAVKAVRIDLDKLKLPDADFVRTDDSGTRFYFVEGH